MRGELKHYGWIKTYSRETGWGFIVCDQVDRDIFVHWRGFLDPPQHSIAQTDRVEVEFNLDESDPKKPKATEVVMEGRRKMRRVVEERVDDRKTLRLVEAAVSTPSEREASRTWGRRRDGADLPPLRRGQRPKPPVEPLQDLGSPTRSAPSRPHLNREHRHPPPPRSTRDLPRPEERPPLPRKVKGMPPPPSQRDGEFFRSGSNGVRSHLPSRSRSRSLRRPLAHRVPRGGDPKESSAPRHHHYGRSDRSDGDRSDRNLYRRYHELQRERLDRLDRLDRPDRLDRDRVDRMDDYESRVRERSQRSELSYDRPRSYDDRVTEENGVRSFDRENRGRADERPERERNERAPTERPERERSEQSEKWPNAGGEMKVLLPNAMAEDLDRDGELAEIASQTKATVDLHDAVGGLHQICEGHRLLTLRGQRGSELQAVIQALLAKAEKMPRRGDVQLKVLLPRFLASVVIGKRGSNVKELQRETGTRVQVEGGAMGQDRVTTVSGPAMCICNALGRIHRFGTEGEEDVPDTEGRDGQDQENGRDEPRPELPPAPWEMKEHPDAPGEFYYLNTETGETTWDRPNEGSQDSKPPPPPEPWILQEHPEAAGEFYYLNEETGETCWELPNNAF